MAEMTPKYSSPNILTDSEPTPAAPIVCAMVFSESMAATGLSIFVLYFFNKDADRAPWLSFMEMKDMGVDSKTASRTEHKKESDNAPIKYNKISPI